MDISHNNWRKRFTDLCVSVKVNAAARHRLLGVWAAEGISPMSNLRD